MPSLTISDISPSQTGRAQERFLSCSSVNVRRFLQDDRRRFGLWATVQHWLLDKLVDRILDSWISDGWGSGPQAAGEVATLKFCHHPDAHKTADRVKRFLTDGAYEPTVAAGLKLGVAHTLAVAWQEPALRALTTPLIVNLVPTADGFVVEALESIFLRSGTLAADDHTRSLLETLLDPPINSRQQRKGPLSLA